MNIVSEKYEKSDEIDDILDSLESMSTIPRPVLIEELYVGKHYPSFLDLINSKALQEKTKKIIQDDLSKREKEIKYRLKCYWCEWYFISEADHKRHGLFCP